MLHREGDGDSWTWAAYGSTVDVTAELETVNFMAISSFSQFIVTTTTTTPMGGTYTVDNSGATADYTSIQEAVNALTARGVSGPVTFNIVPGILYQERISMGLITGVSATDTITFTSDPTTGNYAVIGPVAPPTAAADNYVFQLNSADYVTFNKLEFNAPESQWSRIIDIVYDSDNITIDNNIFNGYGVAGGSYDQSVIVAAGATGMLPDNLQITNNIVNAGTFAIAVLGAADDYMVDARITDNTLTWQADRGIYAQFSANAIIARNLVTNQAGYGIYAHFSNDPVIARNTVESSSQSSSDFHAIRAEECYGETRISKNTIDCVNGGTGIHIQGSDGPGSGSSSWIANNVIHTGGTDWAFGINMAGGVDYWNVYHNTIHVSSTHSDNGIAFWHDGGDYGGTIDIRNNIYSNTGPGFVYRLAVIDAIVSNNNILYGIRNDIINLFGTGWVTLDELRNTYGREAGSISDDPRFVDEENGDYQLDGSSPAIGLGDDTVPVYVDMLLNGRPDPAASSPDAGAYENPQGEPIAGPAPPTDVNAYGAPNYGYVTVEWTPNYSETVDYYSVYRSTVGQNDEDGAEWVGDVLHDLNTFYDFDVVDGGEYWYWVSSIWEDPDTQIEIEGDYSLFTGAVSQGQLLHSGSDGYGYTWVDSDHPDGIGPTYDWVELTEEPGAGITILGDEGYTPLDLPFSPQFEFYGVAQPTINVTTNGLLSFDAFATAEEWYTPVSFPNPATPNALIAPFWQDMNGADVYYWHDATNNRFIIQYDYVQSYSSPPVGSPPASGVDKSPALAASTIGEFTFQVQLYGDGTIMFLYEDMSSDLTEGSVGIENYDGTDGLTMTNQAPYIHDGLAIKIDPPPVLVAVTFQVNMNYEIAQNRFDPVNDAVYVVGSFNGWQTDADEMWLDDNGIYQLEIDLDGNSAYEYKFKTDWVDHPNQGWEELSHGGNRAFTVADEPLTLPLVYFDQLEGESPGFASGEFDGSFSRALVLDGSPVDPNVAIPAALTTFTGNITVEAWIFPTELPGWQSGMMIVNRPYAGEPYHDYELRISNWDDDRGDDPRIEFAVSRGTVPYDGRVVTDPNFVAVGEWTHVAGTYDQNSGELKLYINGVDVATTGGWSGDIGSGGLGLYIGGFGGFNFEGLIDEVRLWNYTRTDFNDRTSPLSGGEAGLVGYWPLDQIETINGQEGILSDKTSNQNHLYRGGRMRMSIWGFADLAQNVRITPRIRMGYSEVLVTTALYSSVHVSGWPEPDVSIITGQVGDMNVTSDYLYWAPGMSDLGRHYIDVEVSNDAGSAIFYGHEIWVNEFDRQVAEHNNNNVNLALSNDGQLGFEGLSSGYGISFNGEQADVMGGLAVAISSDQVSSPLAGNDYTPRSQFGTIGAPLPDFDQAYEVFYDDARSYEPIGIRVSQKSASKSSAPDNNFILLGYDIENVSGSNLNGVYIGLPVDWDVGNYDTNLGGYDAATGLIYVFDDNGDGSSPPQTITSSPLSEDDVLAMSSAVPIKKSPASTATATSAYYGIVPLSQMPAAVAIGSRDSGYNVHDDQALWNMISGGQISPNPTVRADIFAAHGFGPFNMAAGEWLTVSFAIVAGSNLSDIQNNAAAAQAAWDAMNMVEAPTDFTATPQDGAVYLSWNHPGIDHFEILWHTGLTPDLGSTGTPLVLGAATNFTHGSLTNGTQYNYWVVAVDGDGNSSDPVGPQSATPQSGAIPAPYNLTADAVNTSIDLGWQGDTGGQFNQFEIHRNTANNLGTATFLDGTVNHNYTDNGVTDGVTYYYWVRRSDSGSEFSDWSNVAQATAERAPEPEAITEGASKVKMTSAVLNGMVYPDGVNMDMFFDYGTSSIALNQTIATVPAAVDGIDPVHLTANLTGLTAGGTYFFELRDVSFQHYGGVVQFTTPDNANTTVDITVVDNSVMEYDFSGTTAGEGVSLDFTSGLANGAQLSVAEVLDAPVNPPSGSALNQYWDIKLDIVEGDINVTITFDLPPNTFTTEQVNNFATMILLYHRLSGTTGAWTTTGTPVNATTNSVTFSGIDSFSEFTLGIFEDQEAPAVSSVTVTSGTPVGQNSPATIRANVSDNVSDPVPEVWLHWVKGGTTSPDSTQMTYQSLTAYDATIAGNHVTLNGLSVAVSATDDAGNYIAPVFQSVDVAFGSGDIATNMQGSAYSSGLPIGSADNNQWRLISVPGELNGNNNTANNVFETELGPVGDETWKIFESNNEAYRAATTIAPARGYWIQQRVQSGISIEAGDGIVTDVEAYSITLTTGWNLIGNPYPFPVSVSFEQPFHGPRTYNGDGWDSGNAGTIRPWGGYAVYNFGPGSQDLIIEGATFGKRILAKAAEPLDGWEVNLSLAGSRYTDQENRIGRRASALNELDKYDSPEPPNIEGFISLSMSRPEWGEHYPAFTSDIRSTSENDGTWEMALNTKGESGPIDVDFSIAGDIPAGTKVVLMDLIERASYDLTVGEKPAPLTRYHEGYSYPLLVIAGSDAYIQGAVAEAIATLPQDFTMGMNYPNPFNPSTRLPYSVMRPARVSLKVYNLIGQEVADLYNGWQDMGEYVANWNGLDKSGQPVASGIYIAIYRAEGQMDTQKMLMMK
ncbi:LamG-like jellyroll fold domain-containing protein [Candidatus Neomarinimicrobiota bacterium]